MNIFTIHGRLARDPELTRDATDPKRDRCKFTVAVDRRYGDESDFFDCVIFGKRAGVIDKFFRKGSEIAASGELQTRIYDDKNGVRRKAYTLSVDSFDFCGSKGDNTASEPTGTQTQPAPAQTEAAPAEAVPEGFEQIEEDIPF